MDKKRWVQHISGKGAKWEVLEDFPFTWKVRTQDRIKGDLLTLHLPKSEYDLCDPPVEWEDVTEECKVYAWDWPGDKHNGTFYIAYKCDVVKKSDYRISKVDSTHEGPSFIVERKKS